MTVNDAEHADFALEVAAELFGPDRAIPLPNPIMGSEDFSRVLAEVPGAFVFLGACAGDDPDDRARQPLPAGPVRRRRAAATPPGCWPSWPGSGWSG